MKLQQLVEALDAQVMSGDVIGAFDKFAAENCITLSNAQDMTHNKAQKLEILNWFFQNIANVNRIDRLACQVGKDVTESQFVFDFVNQQGEQLVYNEVIRRVWKDGRIVEEQYQIGQTLETPTKTAAKKPSKKAAAKTEKPAAAKASKSTKVAEPKADKKPVAKSAKGATGKTDKLTLIEGIGPKIAELLEKGGIANFDQLAAAKPEAIKAILTAAGSRYQMHDPSTWPKQAALARDGKTAELKKLQTALKGGRK
ncbi:MAG: hypothetical protein EP344_14195 [Bacteroidetes bacterium]|nr:MAG: hypothetical protein EP344_14195 [Bacteroidota bacterium]